MFKNENNLLLRISPEVASKKFTYQFKITIKNIA